MKQRFITTCVVMLLSILGIGVPSAKADRYYQRVDEPVFADEIKPGVQYVLNCAKPDNAGERAFLNGTTFTFGTENLSLSCVYTFEVAGKNSKGESCYYIKNSEGRYFSMPGREVGYTANKDYAWKVTVKAVNADFDPDYETTITDEDGEEQDLTGMAAYRADYRESGEGLDLSNASFFGDSEYGVVIASAEPDDASDICSTYTYLLGLNNGAKSGNVSRGVNYQTNVWVIYTTEQQSAEAYLEAVICELFPDGWDPENINVGIDPGCYTQEAVDAMTEVYENVMYNATEDNAEELAEALKKAYEAFKNSFINFGPGYYIFTTYRSARGALFDNTGNLAGAKANCYTYTDPAIAITHTQNGTEYSIGGGIGKGFDTYAPEEEDPDNEWMKTAVAPYIIWEVIETDEPGLFYVKNRETGQYIGTPGADQPSNKPIPVVKDPNARFNMAPSAQYAGFWKFYSPDLTKKSAWGGGWDMGGLHAPGDVLNMVTWDSETDGSLWSPRTVTPEMLEVIDLNKKQPKLNMELENLVTEATNFVEGTKVYSIFDLATGKPAEGLNVFEEEIAVDGLIQSVDQLDSNSIHVGDGQGLEGLLDGDYDTYYHSGWNDDYAPTETVEVEDPENPGYAKHYIQMDLGKACSQITVKWFTRGNGNVLGRLNKTTIYASKDGENYEPVAEGEFHYTPFDAANKVTVAGEVKNGWVGVCSYDLGAAYQYVRVEHTENVHGQVRPWMNGAELRVYEGILYEYKYDVENSPYEAVSKATKAELDKQLAAAEEELKDELATEATIDALKKAFDAFKEAIATPHPTVELSATLYGSKQTLSFLSDEVYATQDLGAISRVDVRATHADLITSCNFTVSLDSAVVYQQAIDFDEDGNASILFSDAIDCAMGSSLHYAINCNYSEDRTANISVSNKGTLISSVTYAGTLNDWHIDDSNYDFTPNEDHSVWTYTLQNVELQGGERYEYKVVFNHTWAANWNGKESDGNNAVFFVGDDGTYNVTITYNASGKLTVDCEPLNIVYKELNVYGQYVCERTAYTADGRAYIQNQSASFAPVKNHMIVVNDKEYKCNVEISNHLGVKLYAVYNHADRTLTIPYQKVAETTDNAGYHETYFCTILSANTLGDEESIDTPFVYRVVCGLNGCYFRADPNLLGYGCIDFNRTTNAGPELVAQWHDDLTMLPANYSCESFANYGENWGKISPFPVRIENMENGNIRLHNIHGYGTLEGELMEDNYYRFSASEPVGEYADDTFAPTPLVVKPWLISGTNIQMDEEAPYFYGTFFTQKTSHDFALVDITDPNNVQFLYSTVSLLGTPYYMYPMWADTYYTPITTPVLGERMKYTPAIASEVEEISIVAGEEVDLPLFLTDEDGVCKAEFDLDLSPKTLLDNVECAIADFQVEYALKELTAYSSVYHVVISSATGAVMPKGQDMDFLTLRLKAFEEQNPEWGYISLQQIKFYYSDDSTYSPSSVWVNYRVTGLPYTLTLDFKKGWNWYSYNLPNYIVLSNGYRFANAVAPAVTYITSQTEAVAYNEENETWYGYLDTFDYSKGYKAYAEDPITLEYSADPADVTSKDVTLNAGWNWIGFIPRKAMMVSEAFSKFTPAEGDIVKSLEFCATYYNGTWIGDFMMEPGQGYLYHNVKADSYKFYYADIVDSYFPTPTRIQAHNADGGFFDCDIHQYCDNMAIIARIADADAYRYVVGIFSGDECRGKSVADHGYQMITAHGESGEELQMAILDTLTGELYEAADADGAALTMKFNGASAGTPAAPVMINLGARIGDIATGIRFNGVTAGHDNIYGLDGRRVVSGNGVVIKSGRKSFVK